MKRAILLCSAGLLGGMTPAMAQQAMPATLSCETPWAGIDTEADGQVTAEEAQRHIDTTFALADGDANGEISRDEFRACLAKVATPEPAAWPERTADVFAGADANADGRLDATEFRIAAERAHDGSKGATGEAALAASQPFLWLDANVGGDSLATLSADEAAGRAVFAFRSLDRNGDRFVSQDEWGDRETPSGMSDKRADRKFDNLDTDSSDTIGMDEHRAQWSGVGTLLATAAAGAAASGEAPAGDAPDAEGPVETPAVSAPPQPRRIPVFSYRFQAF